MSSSQLKFVIPGISETSSVSELVDVLRSSFKKEVFDEVERLLISQRTELQTENCDLREKNKLLQQELKQSRELVCWVRGTGEMANRKHDQVYRQLKYAYAELEKMKAEKDNFQNNIIQNMLRELTVLEEEGPSTPLFDLNVPPPQ